MWVRSLGQDDPLEEEIATHFSILAWEIPWKEEPEGLQSMSLKRVGHRQPLGWEPYHTHTNIERYCKISTLGSSFLLISPQLKSQPN